MPEAGLAGGQKKFLPQDNLKGTCEWDHSKWKMNPCSVACTTAGEAQQERCTCWARCHTSHEHPVSALGPCWLLCSRQEGTVPVPCSILSPMTMTHSPPATSPHPPASHPTATGLPNCLLALECNNNFSLSQEPKQICSCVS